MDKRNLFGYSRSSGFTLIELLVSASILAIVLLASLGIMMTADEVRVSSRDADTLGRDLHAANEWIMTLPYSDFVNPDNAYDGYEWSDPNLNGYGNLPDEVIRLTFLLTEGDDPDDPDAITYQIQGTYTNQKGDINTDSIVMRRPR